MKKTKSQNIRDRCDAVWPPPKDGNNGHDTRTRRVRDMIFPFPIVGSIIRSIKEIYILLRTSQNTTKYYRRAIRKAGRNKSKVVLLRCYRVAATRWRPVTFLETRTRHLQLDYLTRWSAQIWIVGNVGRWVVMNQWNHHPIRHKSWWLQFRHHVTENAFLCTIAG